MEPTDVELMHAFVLKKLAKIRHLAESDPEQAHSDADAALLVFLKQLGYADVVDAWYAVRPKWYA